MQSQSTVQSLKSAEPAMCCGPCGSGLAVDAGIALHPLVSVAERSGALRTDHARAEHSTQPQRSERHRKQESQRALRRKGSRRQGQAGAPIRDGSAGVGAAVGAGVGVVAGGAGRAAARVERTIRPCAENILIMSEERNPQERRRDAIGLRPRRWLRRTDGVFSSEKLFRTRGP